MSSNAPGKGLENRYAVYRRRADGHEEPLTDQVFVLRPTTDKKARTALLSYAGEAIKDGNHRLAEDIMDWIERIESQEHIEARLRELPKDGED